MNALDLYKLPEKKEIPNVPPSPLHVSSHPFPTLEAFNQCHDRFTKELSKPMVVGDKRIREIIDSIPNCIAIKGHYHWEDIRNDIAKALAQNPKSWLKVEEK